MTKELAARLNKLGARVGRPPVDWENLTASEMQVEQGELLMAVLEHLLARVDW